MCGVSRDSVRRGLKAKEKGRAVGVPGRPRLLSPKEEAELVRVLKEEDNKGRPVKLQNFKDIV